MVLTTEWSQVEVIDFINDGNGLGFMLVGGKSTGVVIKALLPGGLAERDGRLQPGDHVLQIGDTNLRGYNSEQVASVLRQCGSQVRLVVARPIEPSSDSYQQLSSHAPIVPTKMLTDPEELDRTLQTCAYSAGFIQSPEAHMVPHDLLLVPPGHIEVVAVNNAINVENHSELALVSSPMSQLSPEALENNFMDLPETETQEVELRKNVYGLGITVAGYVCEEEDLCGIFVKSIIEGSAAEISGRIQINDRIIAVNGTSLSGISNYKAVEMLRNTDIAVKLTLERYLRGRKFEHLQVALVEGKARTSLPPSPSITTLSVCPPKSDADSIFTEGAECECNVEADMASCTTIDSNIFALQENGVGHDSSSQQSTPTPKVEQPPSSFEQRDGGVDDVVKRWSREMSSEIVVCEVNKLAGLGISLEGTVDVEKGVELRPHHYIRSILPEGPVGKTGLLLPGDELLQVNEHKLQGMNHTEVVKILRDLPSRVKVVCARGHSAPTVIDTSQDAQGFETRNLLPGGLLGLTGMLTKAQSESSIYTSSTATLTDQQRSKSMEQVSGLALWNTDIVFVEIEKTGKGFGFSILDYQDPLDTDGTVIVVRGLIPGGSAEHTCSIFPGDRLVSVNEHSLDGASLDEAVAVLKAIPPGKTRIGLCRPLSTSDSSSPAETPT